MTQLLTGMVLFFGMHSVSIVAPGWRDRVAANSPILWRAFYALISLAGIVLIVRGYAELRLTPSVLYVTPHWMRYVSAIILLPTFILFLAPFFPGRIKTATKFPLLAATKLWALAHLLVNGTAADVLLFGSFLGWAVADRISMKRRTARPLPGAPESDTNDIIIVVLGLLLYGFTLMWAHAALFGVQPLPL
jgi:uncharacterized membrane protein